MKVRACSINYNDGHGWLKSEQRRMISQEEFESILDLDVFEACEKFEGLEIVNHKYGYPPVRDFPVSFEAISEGLFNEDGILDEKEFHYELEKWSGFSIENIRNLPDNFCHGLKQALEKQDKLKAKISKRFPRKLKIQLKVGRLRTLFRRIKKNAFTL